MTLTAALDAPDGTQCQGHGEHKGYVRNFVVYYQPLESDKIMAVWCDKCAQHADMIFGMVCPLIRLEEHGTGVWQAHDGWWGAPLFSDSNLPDLNAEFFVPDAEGWTADEKKEILSLLSGLEALPG